MLRLERHGDVVRIIMSSATSRAAGYAVSAYRVDGVLIDCGFPTVRHELRAYLDAQPISGAMITHSHEDHAGNVGLMAQEGVPVAAGEETLQVLGRAPRIELYRRIVWGQPAPVTPAPARFAPERLRMIATPGHSSDHHVVWDEARDAVFAGDLYVGVRVRVAHADEDPREQVRSLRMVASLKPRYMFDAHRGPVKDATAALEAKAAWMEETIGEVERLVAAGWTDRAITRRVLGREEPVHYFSAGHYSHINFVKSVRRQAGVGPEAGAAGAADERQRSLR